MDMLLKQLTLLDWSASSLNSLAEHKFHNHSTFNFYHTSPTVSLWTPQVFVWVYCSKPKKLNQWGSSLWCRIITLVSPIPGPHYSSIHFYNQMVCFGLDITALLENHYFYAFDTGRHHIPSRQWVSFVLGRHDVYGATYGHNTRHKYNRSLATVYLFLVTYIG